ncbi:TPT-domain-containing protein [Trichodelitschia bisporula]|uniref:TPT-domain-containing protein n=1 Tax=Trichodelitschia bisporula TaxID=703511 RepID=A0A6G1I1S5_9PEZI|nr:TPT-domain-containing protein [Trichodelitschia bisporula]
MSEDKARSSGERERTEVDAPVLPTVNPAAVKSEPPKHLIPAWVYIAVWIALSSAVIVFNKWILDRRNFRYPIFLTTWHLIFATAMTQFLARFTTLLDSRKKVPMTGRVYLRAIVPIGAFFSLSLIFGNAAYLYLSVAFIQMLKATTPVAVLLVSWTLGISPYNMRTLANVSVIVFGVIIASIGEIKFVMVGFVVQILGLTCEATRLAMVERLLSSSEFKMDPLVSLYYFAPACATMNFVVWLFLEMHKMSMDKIFDLGLFTLLANATIAFMLNVAVVFLIGRTSSLVLTLSGVLKDILLVIASMVVFLDPVSGLQAFGYSIALCGLVYYKLGGDKLKGVVADGQRTWGDYGVRHPIMRKLIVVGSILLLIIVIMGPLAPSIPQEYNDYAKTKISTLLGEKGA